MIQNKRKQHPAIIYEDLTAKLIRGKYGEYTYKTPRWGYKRAYKYNGMIYIYITGKEDDGWLDSHCLQNATKKNILAYLREYKATRRYAKAIKGGGSSVLERSNSQDASSNLAPHPTKYIT